MFINISDDWGSTGTRYDAVKNFRFAPQSDIISNRLPIVEVEFDLITYDEIPVGWYILLEDDDYNGIFLAVIMDSYRVKDNVLHLRGQSELVYLDRKKMPAKMYNNMGFQAALDEITAGTNAGFLYSSDIYAGKTISGFCPEQTARERLQHIMFAFNLYIEPVGDLCPVLRRISDATVKDIPEIATYWYPELQWQEWVTKVSVTAFSFTQGTPTSDDEYVQVGNTKYIVSRNVVSLNNQSAPSVVGKNELEFDDVMLVNNSNVDDCVSTLGTYYFKRLKVDADIINNWQYFVGDKCTIKTGDNQSATGYVESLDYQQGKQMKTSIVLGACDVRETKRLTVRYISKENPPGEVLIGTRVYDFPANYNYTVTNPFITVTIKGFQYVFRPASLTTTGTMGNTAKTVTVNCYVALRKEIKTGILKVVSVDTVTRTQQGTGADAYYEAEID